MLVHCVDKDGDGHLDYEEFVKIMMAREADEHKLCFWNILFYERPYIKVSFKGGWYTINVINIIGPSLSIWWYIPPIHYSLAQEPYRSWVKEKTRVTH